MDKEKNLKVSVTIPVRNGGKTLQQCLNSVLNQTYKNYEVILVDNNSTDKTKEIIKRNQKKNKKIKYIFEPRVGIGAARNTGVKFAKGEIITITDSDCIVPKKWIKNLIKPILKEKESIVIGFEYPLNKNYWSKNFQESQENNFKKMSDGKYIKGIDTKNFAIRADLMKRLMFNENLESQEDFDLYRRLKNNYKVRFLPGLKVGHYHKNSLFGIMLLNFKRGYWNIKVTEKYKLPKIGIVKNFILFPFWLVLQFLKKPGRFLFLSVSEISWRLGIIFEKLESFFKKR